MMQQGTTSPTTTSPATAAQAGASGATGAQAAGTPDAGTQDAASQGTAITLTNSGGPIVLTESGGQPVTFDFKDGNLIITQGGTTREIPWSKAVPQGAVDIAQALVAIVFLLLIAWPISRALVRYINRRGVARADEHALRQQFEARFQTMERNLDTVAIEVEKLSEAQRFTTKLLSERGERVPADLTPR